MSKCFVVEHSLDLVLPFGTFERNMKDFALKHECEDQMPYAVSTDGKFRMELKEAAEVENHLVRITGWRDERALHLRKLYVAEPLVLDGVVTDFLDLLEVWAKEHKGCFYFKYVDVDEQFVDEYRIVRGLEKYVSYTEHEVLELLEQWSD